MKKNRSSSFFKSLIYAFSGVKYFFLNERNGKIQLCLAVLTFLLGTGLGLTSAEWIAILICIASVISLEMLNTAIENLCDLVHEEFHPKIKIAKDVAAGAVLCASIISAIIGSIIFIPKIIMLL